MRLHNTILMAALIASLTACGGSNSSSTPASSVASAPTPSSAMLLSSAASSKSSIAVSSTHTSSSVVALSCTSMLCETTNKATVQKIYDEVINKNKTELINTIFATDLVQHGISTSNGATGEMALIQTLKNNTPGFVATIKHIAADGDYVAVHWHLSDTPSNEFKGKAVVDLYKLSNNVVVEHWDVYENLNTTTKSGNSLFSDLYQYKGTKPQATQDSELANKTLVTSFYLGLFNDGNLSLIDQYVDVNYLQHNPYVPNGSGALRAFVSSIPHGGLSFFVTLSDDDLVWTFSGNGTIGGVDIFRVDNQKIVEHYDVF